MAFRFKARSTTPGEFRLSPNTLSQLVSLDDIREGTGRGDGGVGTLVVSIGYDEGYADGLIAQYGADVAAVEAARNGITTDTTILGVVGLLDMDLYALTSGIVFPNVNFVHADAGNYGLTGTELTPALSSLVYWQLKPVIGSGLTSLFDSTWQMVASEFEGIFGKTFLYYRKGSSNPIYITASVTTQTTVADDERGAKGSWQGHAFTVAAAELAQSGVVFEPAKGDMIYESRADGQYNKYIVVPPPSNNIINPIDAEEFQVVIFTKYQGIGPAL